MGSGDDATDVDLGTGGEVDACSVDEVNLTVGVELAVDLAGIGAVNAVEGDGVGAGLDKVNLGLAANIKGVPVNGGAVTGLGDGHGVAIGADSRNTGGNLAAGGQLIGRRGCCNSRPTAEHGNGGDGAGDAGDGLLLAMGGSRFTHGNPGHLYFAPDNFKDAVE